MGRPSARVSSSCSNPASRGTVPAGGPPISKLRLAQIWLIVSLVGAVAAILIVIDESPSLSNVSVVVAFLLQAVGAIYLGWFHRTKGP
jgi:hypothetical protein